MIAADTGTWVVFLEGGAGEDAQLLDRALKDRQVLMVPVVLTELLSDPKLPSGVAETLSEVPLVEIASGYWQRAGALRAKVLAKRRKARFGDALPVMGDEAGLHLVLGLPDDANDREVTAASYDAGVIVRPLASYYNSETPERRGLLLGYACVPNERIGPAFDTLAGVIERTAMKTPAVPTRAA